MSTLRPLIERPTAEWAGVKGVLADIDDTLTTHGRLTSPVLHAMERLREAGLLVVPITGRPAGWCDLIARLWPVDAVVGENGAFYFRYDHQARRMIRRYVDAPQVRAEHRRRLAAIAETILGAVPGTALAADQPYRETDVAIDYCEDVAPLSEAAVQEIVRQFEAHGATAKVSSIHVNGWLGQYDKLTMTRWLMSDEFGVDLTGAPEAYIFVGDSPNDVPMFGFFPNAVGVANVRQWAGQCAVLPRWVTRQPYGDGFAELADTLLASRLGA